MMRALLLVPVAFTLIDAPAATTNVPMTFRDYACTQNCSGHVAGYNWARKKAIKSAADCNGHSQSFKEGCIARVNEVAPPPLAKTK